MAKAKKPAAKKNGSTAGSKSAANPAAAKSSASAAASKASAAAKADTPVEKASTAVSPSALKKELEASAKPVPKVAKEPPNTVEVKDTPKEPVAAEKSPVVSAAPPAEPETQRSIFVPLVLGGVVAAVLGFLASELDMLGNRGNTDDLRATLISTDARVSALEAIEAPEVNLSALDSMSSDLSEASGQMETLATQISDLSARFDDLNTRLTVLEKQPITDGNAQSQAAVAAYERELAALQASVEEQRAEIEGLLNNALSVEEATAQTARAANIQGALTTLSAALNTGQPFSDALGALAEQGVSDIPAALNDVAADGVQTLNALQTRFPDSARASLGAARASGTEDGETGFGGFLRRQLGARSVTPREGNSPDAVLSRAEAAVREGRLNDAIRELDTLPAPAQEAMQDWLSDARARKAAEAATQDLSQSLTAN